MEMLSTKTLTFQFSSGATPTDMAAHLRFQAGLLEGMEPKVASSVKNTSAEVEAEEPAPKAKRGRPAKETKVAAAESFDEDEETEVEETETEEESFEEESFEDEEAEEEAPAPKKAKAKKVTLDDVNDACKAFARANGGGKEGRDMVLKLLKKNFKTTSISELAVEDYAKALKLLAV